jgi:hypothetical protein
MASNMTRVEMATLLDSLDALEARVRGRKARVRGHAKDGPLVPKLAPALATAWQEGWAEQDDLLAE